LARETGISLGNIVHPYHLYKVTGGTEPAMSYRRGWAELEQLCTADARDEGYITEQDLHPRCHCFRKRHHITGDVEQGQQRQADLRRKDGKMVGSGHHCSRWPITAQHRTWLDHTQALLVSCGKVCDQVEESAGGSPCISLYRRRRGAGQHLIVRGVDDESAISCLEVCSSHSALEEYVEAVECIIRRKVQHWYSVATILCPA